MRRSRKDSFENKIIATKSEFLNRGKASDAEQKIKSGIYVGYHWQRGHRSPLASALMLLVVAVSGARNEIQDSLCREGHGRRYLVAPKSLN